MEIFLNKEKVLENSNKWWFTPPLSDGGKIYILLGIDKPQL